MRSSRICTDWLQQIAQSVVCNRYHTARQRLCRWLLMTQDRATADTIPLTQEFLGHMLGATRKRVSYAAAQLQDAGCIRQRHGQIRILNRRGLEQHTCECYRAIAEQRHVPAAADDRTPTLPASRPAGRSPSALGTQAAMSSRIGHPGERRP